MARARTHDEIVTEMAYAVLRVARHYGPGLSEEGFNEARRLLSSMGPWWCDSSWRVDEIEGEEKDFHELLPEPFNQFDSFEYVMKEYGWPPSSGSQERKYI